MQDGDYNPLLLSQRCAKECADTLGNSANRILNRLFMPACAATLAPGIRLQLPWGQLAQHGVVAGSRQWGSGAAAPLSSSLSQLQHIHQQQEEQRQQHNDQFEQQTIHLTDEQCALLGQANALLPLVSRCYEEVEPSQGLEAIMGVLQVANKVYAGG